MPKSRKKKSKEDLAAERGAKVYQERARRAPKSDDSRYPFGLLGILPLMNNIYFPKKHKQQTVREKAAA